MFFLKIIIIFIVSLFATILYLAFWAEILTGGWLNVSFVFETPLAIIVAFIAPMIFVTWKNFPLGRERDYFLYGFFGLLILLLFVMAVEKYSFMFPQETRILMLHPLEPIIFTISASFILQGMSKMSETAKLKTKD